MPFAPRTLRTLLAVTAIATATTATTATATATAGAQTAELPQPGRLSADTATAGPDGTVALLAGDGSPGRPVAVRLAAPLASAFATALPLPAEARDATLAAGPGGALAAVWTGGDYDHGTVLVAYRAPGAVAFGAPEAISDDPPRGEQWPTARFDGAGTLTVAWAPGLHEDQMLVRSRAADGTWTPAQALRARRPFRPRLAVTPNGSAALAWSDDDERRVAVAVRPAGSGVIPFAAPRVVSDRPRSAEPAVAANDRGDVAVAWDQDATGEGDFSVLGTSRPAGAAAFEPPRRISRPHTQAAFPSVSVAPDGRTVFAYGREAIDGQNRVEAAVRTRTGRLLRRVVLDRSAQDGTAEALAVGRGLVAWFHRDRPHHRSALWTATARADALSFDRPRVRYVVPRREDFAVEPLVFAAPGGGLVTVGPGTALTRSPG